MTAIENPFSRLRSPVASLTLCALPHRFVLIIRLQRIGRENLPAYRLVVAEKARPVKGNYLEILGHFLPARDPSVFECEKERITFWMKRGAALSETAARLLKKQGIDGTEKYIKRYAKRKSKSEAPVAAAAVPPAPAASAPLPSA